MPTADIHQEQSSVESQEIWGRFSCAETQEEYFEAWLALQCELVDSAVQAVIVTRQQQETFAPVAVWPQQGSNPSVLAEVLEQVIADHCGLLVEVEGGRRTYGLAYPVLVDEQLTAVVAMEVVGPREQQLQTVMEQLQWGVSWLELHYRRARASEEAAISSRLRAAVDLLAVTLGEERFTGAAMAFVTELAAVSHCDRVSIGFLHGHNVRIVAVSNSADFDRKMNLPKAIALAMDEAILQRRELVCPAQPGAEALITQNHELLSKQQNQAGIVTFPLFFQERYYGALTCERQAGSSFSEADIEFIRAVVAMAGPALLSKEQNDRSVIQTIGAAAKIQINRLFGENYLGRKFFVLLSVLLIIFMFFVKGEYRLAADTTIEGAVRRAVVAPFDGYIDQAPVRAGDLVEQGALLCALDDRDLRLEQLTRISQKNQLQNQLQEAIAKHDRAQVTIVQSQMDQVGAELALIESNLVRTRLVAPFAGLLVSGDLSQRLGGSVEKGELLFEVSPLDAYRVILKVDDRRIADVNVGQKGTLILSSQPKQKYAFTVSQITPLTIAEGGRNLFRVEATLDTHSGSLRPGMEGVGKISIDERRLIDIWLRDLLEWMKLWLWTWIP